MDRYFEPQELAANIERGGESSHWRTLIEMTFCLAQRTFSSFERLNENEGPGPQLSLTNRRSLIVVARRNISLWDFDKPSNRLVVCP
jgi:hypothetical protein